MFKAILVLSAVLASAFAHATSLNPCTPVIQAQPTRISCRVGDVYYTIIVDTVMSPNTAECAGPNHFERSTATVRISDRKGQVSHQYNLGEGEFTYGLDGTGGANFESESADLHLTQCATPLYGGVSIGN